MVVFVVNEDEGRCTVGTRKLCVDVEVVGGGSIGILTALPSKFGFFALRDGEMDVEDMEGEVTGGAIKVERERGGPVPVPLEDDPAGVFR